MASKKIVTKGYVEFDHFESIRTNIGLMWSDGTILLSICQLITHVVIGVSQIFSDFDNLLDGLHNVSQHSKMVNWPLKIGTGTIVCMSFWTGFVCLIAHWTKWKLPKNGSCQMDQTNQKGITYRWFSKRKLLFKNVVLSEVTFVFLKMVIPFDDYPLLQYPFTLRSL